KTVWYLKLSFLHLQSTAIESGHHCLHVAVLGDVSVGTLVGFSKKRCRRDPLCDEHVSDLVALLHLEGSALQPAFLRVFAESGKQVTDRLAPFHDHAGGKVDLRIIRILRDEAIPVAMVESVKMFIEYGLRIRLLLQLRERRLRPTKRG